MTEPPLGSNPTSSDLISDETLERMRHGDPDALAEVFSHYRNRLQRIVRFRLDYRLAGRISDSDVLQETFIAAARRMDHFAEHPTMPAFLWLRLLVGQQLVDLHRRHLKSEMRDVRKEVSIQMHGSPHTSVALAAQLVGHVTSVSEIVARAERIERLEAILNQMNPIDREVIALRHFEELSNAEAAEVLGIQQAAAAKRYLRAMSQLAEFMAQFEATQSNPSQSNAKVPPQHDKASE